MTSEEADYVYNFFNLLRHEYDVDGPHVLKFVVSSLEHTSRTQGTIEIMYKNLNTPLELIDITLENTIEGNDSVTFRLRIKNDKRWTHCYYDYRDVVFPLSSSFLNPSPQPKDKEETFKFDINNLPNF